VTPAVILLAALAPSTGAASAHGCLRALRPVSAGALAIRGDFAPSPCERPRAAFRYDPASGLARARADLAAGDVVQGLPPALLGAGRPGEKLRLRVQVGPVSVEREVTVLRPRAGGAEVLVRAADGEVFSTPVPEAAP
jgi:hypothetical protein